MQPDMINGLFELVGAYFAWMNAYTLWKEREVKGVYWPTTAFFAAWGIWNLYYYPALGQMWSFYAGVLLVSGNAAWVVLALRFRACKQLSPV
ncbi:MAG TPA: hypothetical protein PLE99_05765 [Candidatus Thiothrix moscowensis]|uniref:hypothetical protein n=1 Tax=unclassified Thiothrix TaxID=2636184 RepID=UPI0025E2B172|nr:MULTISPECIES: hypothetical protein [unclassified Thiothrix]HRJ52251.1 hypothetical protein [Candidatus Thiothrix moscowensis]HRJ92566.1 hypothetical protein [Candidatus Thiothrix moscowensis]